MGLAAFNRSRRLQAERDAEAAEEVIQEMASPADETPAEEPTAEETAEPSETHEDAPGGELNLRDMKYNDLKKLAAGKGIEGTNTMNKEELIAAIEAHEALE